MTGEFSFQRFEIARLKKKRTYVELAKLTGLSQRELKRISVGEVQPRPETVSSLALALAYPAEFFFEPDYEMPRTATFRALESMPERERLAGLAASAHGGLIAQWIEGQFELPEVDVPDLSGTDPHTAAEILRNMWQLADRPIGNIVKLLESRGVRVFSLKEETLKMNAFATWISGKPFIFLNTMKSAESSRFDAAHELAHLCLHRDGQQGKDIEDEANSFAGSFLMPAADVRLRKVYPVIDKLTAAKGRWGVSLSALLYRYRELKLVSDERAKFLYVEMSRRGLLKKEPSPMQRDTSAVWTHVLRSLWLDKRSIEDMARDLRWEVDVLREFALLADAPATGADGPTNRSRGPGLRLVSG